MKIDSSQPIRTRKKPFFSIVIPTLDEEKCIPLLLDDLARQTFFDFEVIVVDGQSKDTTVKKVSNFSSKLRLSCLNHPKPNVSNQRNMGSKKAKGEWIIFMDADNRLPPFFLEGIKYRLAQETDVDIFTTWVTVDGTSPTYRAIERVINLTTELYKVVGKPSAIGACIGCRRSVITHIQFDPRQKFIEDGFFVREAHAAGYSFKVFHDPKFTYSLRRMRKEGLIKMAGTVAMMQLKYVQNKNFFDDNRYVMLGGSYYEMGVNQIPTFERLNTFIKTASKKQLKQAKKIMNVLTDW
jgi:glycosyltransferase involved in cell wall biosynthesis